jgi:putative peptidoglycan lipid II flippase
MLRAGSVSALWYAGRVFEFPIGLVAVAIGTAALPTFADQAVRGARADLRRSLTFSVGLTTVLAVPASLALIVLARPITAVLFQRGAFGPEEVERTALALRAYAVGLWPLSVARVVVPAFYALRDVRAPVRAAGAALLANALTGLALIGPVPQQQASWLAAAIAHAATALRTADLGHAGLALAASIAAVVNVACLIAPLARHLGAFDLRPLLAALRRSLIAALPMAVLVSAAAGRIDWTGPAHPAVKAAWLAATIAVGVLAFGGTALAIGGPEIDGLRRLLAERLGRGHQVPPP